MSLPWDYIAKLVCIGDSGTGKSSLSIRLCEGRFSATHDVTIGVEFGSRVVPVGPPASDSFNIGLNATPTHNSPTPDPESSVATAQKQKMMAKTKAAPQKKMKLSLWDTAGQETYKSVTRSYFRGASGALLVFDITRPETFASVTGWLQDLRQIAEEGIVVVLVGNKCDLANDHHLEDGEDHQTGDNTSSSNQKGGRRRVTRQQAEEWCRLNNVIRYIETSAKSGEGVERAFLEVAERIYRNIEAGQYDLNDRRSGVKGYRAAGTASAAGNGNGSIQPRTLGLNDAMHRGGNGWNNGCC